MPIRILNQSEVIRLLPMAACIDVMAATLGALSEGKAQLPLRTILRLRDRKGFFGTMPAELETPDTLGAKIISVFPGNEGSGLDSHQGMVVLFDPRTGAPEAVLDAASITAIRTAAVSGAATRVLAREDAGDLAILGSGVQARTHLDAIGLVRELRRIRVWSRNLENARAFSEWALVRHGCTVEVSASAEEAVRGADMICTVTASSKPLLEGKWLAEGSHINAVGSSSARGRELDTEAVKRSRLFVDRMESALNEAGDFLIPREEGAVSDAHIRGELGDVLLGRVPGRTGAGDITLFKSLGLAIEDLAAADLVLRRAREEQVGTVIELGGRRDLS